MAARIFQAIKGFGMPRDDAVTVKFSLPSRIELCRDFGLRISNVSHSRRFLEELQFTNSKACFHKRKSVQRN